MLVTFTRLTCENSTLRSLTTEIITPPLNHILDKSTLDQKTWHQCKTTDHLTVKKNVWCRWSIKSESLPLGLSKNLQKVVFH